MNNTYYIGPQEKMELAFPGCLEADDTRILPDGKVLVELHTWTVTDVKAVQDPEITKMDHAEAIRALSAYRSTAPEPAPAEPRPKKKGRTPDETV